MLNSACRFVALMVLATAAAVSHAAVAPTAISSAVVSTRQIVDAMASAGIIVNADQIERLSEVNRAASSATMRVVSVSDRTAGTDTIKAKLRCHDNRECLPFYVLVHGVDSANTTQLGAHAMPAKDGSLQNVVRGGDHATLVLESPHSRMSLPVICLQSGMRGQTIRAASLDRKRFYAAEVVAAGTLKGNF
jgi:flagella basal body P-ring formation protein FlgA